MTGGWRTSEFWLSLASVVLPTLAGALHASGHPALVAAGIAVAGLYTVGRSAAKVAADVRAAAEAKAAALPPFGGMTPNELRATGVLAPELQDEIGAALRSPAATPGRRPGAP